MDTMLWVAGIFSFLIALTVHEFAHALVADKLGDPTPRLHGRLSLNPLRHLDWVGVVAFFLFKIGWAKPVPVNADNFSKPRRDMALVAIAGPSANIIMGMIGLLLREIGLKFGLGAFWYVVLYGFIFINVLLAIFNLLPIPPLDGYKFLKLALPPRYDEYLEEYEKYGPVIIILLFWVFDFGRLLVDYTTRVIAALYGIFIKPLVYFVRGH